ncbi:MAG TPA: hypothetical protein VMG40_14960 [Bryobacteraceae bacterium]|nr:hypothetical protein [Bryobacteraceae bacterium]
MTLHPDVHQPWQNWSNEATLHVACAYSNPLRWRTRRVLMNDFRQHMSASPNVVLHAGELAYGERPFEVTGADPHDVQLRTSHELWHKENLLNVVIQRFPRDWQYGAIIDADFHMTRRDWALEAIHQLQHFDFVQLFSTYSDLSAQYRPYRVMPGFAWCYLSGGVRGDSAYAYGYGSPGATGGAWAFRRSAFDAVGGLLDVCILGSADWHMAFGLSGKVNTAPESTRCSRGYTEAVRRWQERAKILSANIGYVENHAIHHFHGSKVFRAYGDRWKILRDHDFDPARDIVRDWQGVWQLSGNKPRMRDDIRRYFRARNEDDPGLRGSERALV